MATRRRISRWLICVPALFGFATKADAETYELECREVSTWEDAPVYECRPLPEGSKIPEEQRKTLNAVVLLTVVAPLSRMKR